MTLPAYFPIALAVAGIILISFGEMLALPFFNSFVMKRSNEANRGQYAAAYTLTWSVAQIIGPLGGGFIAKEFGYRWLWGVLAMICIVCAIGFKKMGSMDRV